jgi:putative ABC transport system substrate-binding protein
VKRREFITLLGGTAAACPLAARAQQPVIPVIGFLGAESDEMRTARFQAFHQGLGEIGYVDGRNVTIEYRWAEGRIDRFPEMATDLVRRQVNVIAAMAGIPAATAAKAATTTIPIVFQGSFDPVEIGLVASLNRPGGNLTGATNLNLEVGPKRMELLHELLPQANVLGLLINPDHPNAEAQTRAMQTAARALRLQIRIVHVRAVRDFDAAFASLAQLSADGLVIVSGQPFVGGAAELGELAARHAMPTAFESHEFVGAGGLVSYAGNRVDAYRQAGVYVGRILKGENPADLPVQQSTKIELILNLKTAKALGITVPLPLLGRADEVIE